MTLSTAVNRDPQRLGMKRSRLESPGSLTSPQHSRSPGLPGLPARVWWNLPASTIPSARAPPYPPHVAAKDPGGQVFFHNGTMENSVPRCSMYAIFTYCSLKFMVDVGKYYHTWSILWWNLSWIMFTPLNKCDSGLGILCTIKLTFSYMLQFQSEQLWGGLKHSV